MSGHLSDLQLDAMAGGSATPAEAAAIRAHLGACPACAARDEELSAARQDFARRFDARELAAETRPRRPQPWAWGVAVASAAAAALLAGVLLTPSTPPDTRTKGGAVALELFVDDAEPRAVGPDPVPVGSRLRLRFDPGGRRHTRVLWIDPAGRVDALHPAAGEPSIGLLDPHGPRWMDYTIELDAEPADEALVAVFCDAAFDHAQALAALRSGDCAVARLPVRKAD